MSKTACWGFNNTFDCTWCWFGYGSRWDMVMGNYHKGWWLGKDALKLLLYYDYPIQYNDDDFGKWKSVNWELPLFDEEELKEVSGGFMRDNLEYKEIIDTEFLGLRNSYTLKYPTIGAIKKINKQHWNVIDRIHMMDRNAHIQSNRTSTPFGSMSKDEWESCMATDEDMEELYKELQQ